MIGKAFWAFWFFGAVTVVLAIGGGALSLAQRSGFSSGALGFVLLFLGTSLAVMLGSLLFIRMKEKTREGKS